MGVSIGENNRFIDGLWNAGCVRRNYERRHRQDRSPGLRH